jgi:metal-dependent amidase/aminoacylase/carboxypeptidase family protein
MLRSGKALNIIPDDAEIGFELRAEVQQDLDDLAVRATDLVASIARAHGLEQTTSLVGEAADWANPAEVADWAGAVARTADLFPTRLMQHDFGASEDATLMLHAVAARGGTAGYFVLGSDLASAHHTPNFDFDEDVLWTGAAFVGSLALSVLCPRSAR